MLAHDQHRHTRLARRVEADPSFMAHTLASYRRRRRLDDTVLAAVLRCSVEALPRLALCRRPDPDSASFRTDLAHIAHYVGCDADRLASLLRTVPV